MGSRGQGSGFSLASGPQGSGFLRFFMGGLGGPGFRLFTGVGGPRVQDFEVFRGARVQVFHWRRGPRVQDF